MHISIEDLIIRITSEVIRELKAQNVTVTFGQPVRNNGPDTLSRKEVIDMSAYKTPILTERRIQKLHVLTGEVVIPAGTVITPKAKELIRQNKLKITIQ